MKYKIFTWYPWEFGKWVLAGEGGTLCSTLKKINTSSGYITYKITNEKGELIKLKLGRAGAWRAGMIMPWKDINIAKKQKKERI